MATWFLLARENDGEPLISAMAGGNVEKSLTGDSKDQLIGFLKMFSKAETFLVAKPDGDDAIDEVAKLPQQDDDQTNNTVPKNATWFQFFRDEDGQPVVVAMDGARGLECHKGNRKSSLIAFLNSHVGANTFQVASATTPIPPNLPSAVIKPRVLPGQQVMLEIGHGPGVPFDPGAIAYDGRTTEHSLNVIAANAARKVLAAAGVACTVIDKPQGSLHSIGLQASGFDVFCSVHHNAFNNTVQRTEAFSHATKGGILDQELATLISAELSDELNLTNGGGKQANLGVLSGAEDTNVRAAVLAEVYFIDDVLSKPPLSDFSTRGGEAIGRAILKWLKRYPS